MKKNMILWAVIAAGAALALTACDSGTDAGTEPGPGKRANGLLVLLDNAFPEVMGAGDLVIIPVEGLEYDEEGNVIEGDIEEEPYEPFYPAPIKTRAQLEAEFQQFLAQVRANTPFTQGDGSARSAALNVPVDAQVKRLVKELNTNGWTSTTYPGQSTPSFPQGRSGQIQTTYIIYALYSFDQDMDYYIIEVETTIPNQNFWSSSGRHDWYGIIRRDFKEYWMYRVKLSHTIAKKMPDGSLVNLPYSQASVIKESPETANNVTTYTSGVNHTIGGNVGFMGSGTATVNAGVTFSNSKSYGLSDFKATSRSHSNISTPDVQTIWESTKKPEYKTGNNMTNPPDLSRNSATFGASWIYMVEKPGKDDQYVLSLTYDLTYVSSAVYSALWVNDMIHFYIYPTAPEPARIELARPNRVLAAN